MSKKWKIILIALLMLPMVVFFPGCSCSSEEDGKSSVPQEYTVRFYTGSTDTFNIPSQTLMEGSLVRRPDNPRRDGYEFIGWYKDQACTLLWSFEVDTIKSNITLYAYWQEEDWSNPNY